MQNLTLQNLWKLFLLRLKWLILGFVCGGLLLGLYTTFFMQEQYTAKISLYVQNTEEETGVANSNNLAASRMLTQSYMVILRDVETMRMAAQCISMPASVGDIASALSVTASEDSAIIVVSATTDDALLSQSICEAICEVAPSILYDTVGAGTITPLGEVPPAVQTGPQFARNVAMGAAAGFALVALIVLVLFLTDTTIKTKEDLMQVAEAPILGEIPTLNW